MTTDTIPTLAHAVRIGSDLSLYRERERAELIISHAAGGVLVELVDRRDYERERQRRIAAEGAARIAREDASRELRARKALAEVDRLLGSDDRATELRGVIEAVLEGDRLPVYAELEQMTAERDELAARLEQTRTQLKGAQWSGGSMDRVGACPCCGCIEDEGHLPVCELANVLEEQPSASPPEADAEGGAT